MNSISENKKKGSLAGRLDLFFFCLGDVFFNFCLTTIWENRLKKELFSEHQGRANPSLEKFGEAKKFVSKHVVFFAGVDVVSWEFMSFCLNSVW